MKYDPFAESDKRYRRRTPNKSCRHAPQICDRCCASIQIRADVMRLKGYVINEFTWPALRRMIQ